MKKQIFITYNEQCSLIDALERIDKDMEQKKHQLNADALMADADYMRERATRHYLSTFSAKWNVAQ